MTSGDKRKSRVRVEGRTNVAGAVNVGKAGRTTTVSKSQDVEIVQRGRSTRLVEHGDEPDVKGQA